MHLRSIVAVVAVSVVGLAVAACGPQESSPDTAGTWVGTITTEGNVTTVVNESGSVWGGTARLVEELSIGVDAGEDPYIFGPIGGLAATDDRIYVADNLRVLVRVYDHDGQHLFDFGRKGKGPGEFTRIHGLLVDRAGRVVVQDQARVIVFDHRGDLLDTWAYRAVPTRTMTAAADGTVYVPVSARTPEDWGPGVIAVAPDGTEISRLPRPSYDYDLADTDPWQLSAYSRRPSPNPAIAAIGGTVGHATLREVPYAPTAVWAVLPSKAVTEGTNESYRFSVHRPDGTALIVERAGELSEVVPEYAEWETARLTQRMRKEQPDWEWNANPVPATKPAFTRFTGDRHGRIWVSRALGTATVAECDIDPLSVEGRSAIPCWRDLPGLDVFDEDTGRFLGQISLDEPLLHPVFFEDAILTAVEDAAGTIMVKRYRLVLSGDRER